MAISGLAILLASDPALRASALQELGSLPGLELGPQAGARVSAVLDTPSAGADREAVARLEGVRGVLRVDLVCVYFPDDLEIDQTGASGAPP